MRVQTQWAEFGHARTINTIPFDITEEHNMKMVLCWNILITLKHMPDISGQQTIFAENYDKDTGNYYCINNWERKECVENVHNSRICAIYYLSIIEL